jgi:peptide-methionine (S)-S-oxide reductase
VVSSGGVQQPLKGEDFAVAPTPVKDAKNAPQNKGEAIFAAGCFWGVESRFRKEPGVFATAVGYIGGSVLNPTYKQVCSGTTGHAEAVLVVYDKDKTSYAKLLEVFLDAHDPTQLNRQGPDYGTQYRSAVFARTDDEVKAAEAAILKANQSGKHDKPVVTTIERSTRFWFAENYHQQYNEKRGIDSCPL